MAYAFDSDISMMMNVAEFAEPVTIGGVDGVGIGDAQDELIEDSDRPNSGGVVLPLTKITIQTTAFANVRIDDAVVFRGRSYSVRERLRKGDGATTEILLGAPIIAHTFFFGFPF
jgi:hypothetical protein